MTEPKPKTHFYVLSKLQTKYPRCFTDPPAPLKIGIHLDIAKDELSIDAASLRRFFFWYTKRPAYSKALKAGAARIDLDGNPAGEVTAEQITHAKRKPQNNLPPNLPLDLPLTKENIVAGKLDITVKITQLPKPTRIQAGYKFAVNCDGRLVSVTLNPKAWDKLAKAATSYTQWVAALSGKMGPIEGNGFVLLEPAVQVFEKKPKVPEDNPPVASTPPPSGRPKLSLKSK